MTKVYRSLSLMAGLVQAACLLLLLKRFPHHLFGLESDEEKIYDLLGTLSKAIPVLVIISKIFEGSGPTVVPGLLCSIFLFLTLRSGPNTTSSTIYFFLSVTFCALHLLAIRFFFFYKLTTPKGKFRVGYRSVTHNELTFAIFFPSEETGKRKAKYYQDQHAFDKLYAISTIALDLPRALFTLLFDYVTKLKINADQDVSLISPEKLPDGPTNHKFVPIIFSHGLGMHRNAYSCICTDLASRGHIVFSLEHMEEIRNILKDKTEGEVRRKFLEKRVDEVKKLLDNIQQSQFLAEIFKKPVPLALDRTLITLQRRRE